MTALDPRALKPCPFCGSHNVAQGASNDRISVWCDCGARGPDVDFPIDCIDPVTPIKECYGRWNRRALSQPQAGEPAAWQHRIWFEDRDCWSKWRDGRHDEFLANKWEERPLYASPQPANPAQVTDADLRERLDEAEAIISERNDELALIDWISDKIGLPHDEELTRENFAQYLAAIGAGGQAVAPESLIGQPYNPDDERFARLLDSQWRAGRTVGWNECFARYVTPSNGELS